MEIRIKNGACGNLHHLDITISSGKITAVTGKGKSTFLRMLNLQEKMTGTIYFDGTRKILKNQNQLRAKIALVQEDFVYLPFLSTVEEYFLYLISYYHLSCQNQEKKMKDALRIVGLPQNKLFSPIVTLSSAEKRLIQIAEALMLNPDVLLLDEPFYNLDLKNEKKIVRVLEKLQEKYQKTIVFATHDCEQIYQYADQVVLLKDGTILMEGPVEKVYMEEAILLKHHIDIPETIAFTNYVRKKKEIPLGYYKDIRDLIKDIYRNV